MKKTVHSFSQSIGIHPETIRYYRQSGLIFPQIQPNGFYEYDINEAMITLLVREMKAYGWNLSTIKDYMNGQKLGDLHCSLQIQEAALRKQIRLAELKLARIQETQAYLESGLRLTGKVEEFDGPATWAIPFTDGQSDFRKKTNLDQWNEHFPFVYTSVTIPLPLLQDEDTLVYQGYCGLGALIHYVEEFKLPVDDTCFFQPGGHFIRTCITTKSLHQIHVHDLFILKEYAQTHHYRFASCTGGRVLLTQYAQKDPIFHLLVWIRVEPE